MYFLALIGTRVVLKSFMTNGGGVVEGFWSLQGGIRYVSKNSDWRSRSVLACVSCVACVFWRVCTFVCARVSECVCVCFCVFSCVCAFV